AAGAWCTVRAESRRKGGRVGVWDGTSQRTFARGRKRNAALPARRSQGASRGRPMTDLDDTTAALPRGRDFGGVLFWYVAIQVFAVSVFVMAIVVVSFLGAYFRLLDPQQWSDELAAAQGRIQGGASFLALLACIMVASAHKLGFWRGVGGWFAG